MSAWLFANEAVVRVVCFGSIFAAVALAEIAVPRRGLTTSKRRRWTANIGIVIIDTAVLRIFFPAGAVGIALWTQRQGWGLLSSVHWPVGLEILLMGNYRPQPRLGHEGMTIGLRQFHDPRALSLGALLLPFVGKQGAYAINRKGGGEN
jgi:hypothetical protein